MSRNGRSNENGRFDEVNSNRVNVPVLDDLGEFSQIRQSEISLAELTILTKFKSNLSKRNQLGGFDDFNEFSLLHAAFVDTHLLPPGAHQ